MKKASAAAVLMLVSSAFAVDADVRKLARSDDLGDRRRAAEALAEEGSVNAVKLLRTLIEDEYPWVRDWALSYCKKVKDPKAVEALLPLLRTNDVTARRNGVAALGWTETDAAADQLREIALKDKQADVRFEALAWLPSNPGKEASLETLARACADRDPDVRVRALTSLVSMEAATGPELAIAALEDDDEGVRCTALWALSVLAPERVAEHIGRYHESDAWRARLQAIETGLVIRDARCIEVLIDLIEHPHRRVATEAHRALRQITGLEYGREPDLWSAWLEQNRAGWTKPKKLHSLKASKAGSDTTVRYHGIEVETDGVVFAIDASGSMTELMEGDLSEWSRWGIALHRLRKTLEELPDGVRVNIVLFADGVTTAFDNARPLDDGVRKDIDTFLKRGGPGGNTNVWDTLRAVLDMDDVDTLFLLGDGEPNRGAFVLGSRIRPYFWTPNRRRKLVVHTISIGADESGRSLLRKLAEENRGRCVTY